MPATEERWVCLGTSADRPTGRPPATGDDALPAALRGLTPIERLRHPEAIPLIRDPRTADRYMSDVLDGVGVVGVLMVLSDWAYDVLLDAILTGLGYRWLRGLLTCTGEKTKKAFLERLFADPKSYSSNAACRSMFRGITRFVAYAVAAGDSNDFNFDGYAAALQAVIYVDLYDNYVEHGDEYLRSWKMSVRRISLFLRTVSEPYEDIHAAEEPPLPGIAEHRGNGFLLRLSVRPNALWSYPLEARHKLLCTALVNNKPVLARAAFNLSDDAPALNSNPDFTRTLLAARAVSTNPELEDFIRSYSDLDLANAYMYFGPAATA